MSNYLRLKPLLVGENKSKEQVANQLKSHRAPPCRFDFFHIVALKIHVDKLTKIRRRGKEIVDHPHILSTTARNQFGLVALERPQPFRSASSDVGLATMRCNNDFRYMPRGFADARALVDTFHQRICSCGTHLTPNRPLKSSCNMASLPPDR